MHRWLQCLPAQAWKPTSPLKPDMYFLSSCQTINKFKTTKLSKAYYGQKHIHWNQTHTSCTDMKQSFSKQPSAEPYYYYGQKQHNPWKPNTYFLYWSETKKTSFFFLSFFKLRASPKPFYSQKNIHFKVHNEKWWAHASVLNNRNSRNVINTY